MELWQNLLSRSSITFHELGRTFKYYHSHPKILSVRFYLPFIVQLLIRLLMWTESVNSFILWTIWSPRLEYSTSVKILSPVILKVLHWTRDDLHREAEHSRERKLYQILWCDHFPAENSVFADEWGSSEWRKFMMGDGSLNLEN